MIDSNKFLEALEDAGLHFFTGVPDSLLKSICYRITSKYSNTEHIIASNEGAAVALAIGYYLASSKPALVYMQNSGIGNTINPLTSLADSQVYGIPMVLLIGWRGEIDDSGRQIKDEPQHVKQGQITKQQLDLLGVDYEVIDSMSLDYADKIKSLYARSIENNSPVALLVRKNTFESIDSIITDSTCESLPSRERTIKCILEHVPDTFPVISTTGMASREVFEIRELNKSGHHRDFLTVGGMGHASQIATAIALCNPNQRVICIDGDGALIMHAGSLAVSADCDNLIHIVINNAAHDSVGGQPTKGEKLNLANIAKSFGYKTTYFVDSLVDLEKIMPNAFSSRESVFIEVKCSKGARSDLGRPTKSPKENKLDLMNFLTPAL